MYLATLPAIIFLKSIYVHIWRCMYFPFCGVPLNIVYLCICLSVENVWVVRSGFLFVCFVFLLFISPGTLFRWNNSLNWRNIIVPASVNEMLLCVCCVCVCACARVHACTCVCVGVWYVCTRTSQKMWSQSGQLRIYCDLQWQNVSHKME